MSDLDSDKDDNEQIENLSLTTETEIIDTTNEYIYEEKNKTTKPIMTKYEKVLILAKRITQLKSGAQPLLKGKDLNKLTMEEIAELELQNGMIPFKLIRKLPNNIKEIWKITELKLQ